MECYFCQNGSDRMKKTHRGCEREVRRRFFENLCSKCGVRKKVEGCGGECAQCHANPNSKFLNYPGGS